jgi:[acyl-carrier-protein] S-malonyltransferase
MEKTAFLFPGQGSQSVGMGRDLVEKHTVAAETFDTADRVLGYDLSEICFRGPEEKLKETRYTQPAILAHSIAAWRVIDAAGVVPDFVAGHSVGEYSALVASGALEFEDALSLVRVRAEAMFRSGEERPGTMAALVGIEEEGLKSLLEEAGKAGVIAAANYNSPVQVVISGETAAVDAALEIAREHGAKRAVRLKVSGAFHSPLMEPGREALAEALGKVALRPPGVPVVANVSGSAVTSPEEMMKLLERQLTSPVLWTQSMRHLIDAGVDRFVEIGPGSILCGLLKRIGPGSDCISCSDAQGVAGFLEGSEK